MWPVTVSSCLYELFGFCYISNVLIRVELSAKKCEHWQCLNQQKTVIWTRLEVMGNKKQCKDHEIE